MASTIHILEDHHIYHQSTGICSQALAFERLRIELHHLAVLFGPIFHIAQALGTQKSRNQVVGTPLGSKGGGIFSILTVSE